MPWIRSTFTIFKKDLQSELRSRFGISVIFAFVIAAMLLVLFSIRADQLEPIPKATLVWIVILFAALSSLSRSFIAETDKNTFDLLRIYSTGSCVYSGKLLYNFLFTCIVNIATFSLYIFLMNLTIHSWPAFLILLVIGTAGLSGVATMTAAVVSQADRKGAVFSVLSLPLFMPLVLLLSDLSKTAFVSGGELSMNTVTALSAFTGVTITAGIILFDFIWEE